MKTACTHAEVFQMMHMDHGMLDHLTLFPAARAPVVVIAPAAAVPGPVVAVVDPPDASKMDNIEGWISIIKLVMILIELHGSIKYLVVIGNNTSVICLAFIFVFIPCGVLCIVLIQL